MTTIRHLIRTALLLLTLGAAAFSTGLRAEDIDIYFENSSGGVLPKVLFIIDNSANVGSTWGGGGCAGYADGTGAPSLGTNTAGGIIQCALVDTLASLPDGRLEMGIMSGNANNFARSRGCVGSSGGCLLFPLTEINAVNRPQLIAFIKAWKKENSAETFDAAGKLTSFPFTVTNAEAGGMMQEAWAYFYAQTGLSTRTYTKNHIQACQKNFIIYIGNTDKSPANEDASGTALVAAGATGTLADKITTTQKFEPAICGSITEAKAASNSNDWSSNWADEWARFLQAKDGGTATQEGKQNITTYTIGIIDNASNQCTAAYPALLQSMAKVSGGTPFRVATAGEIKDAVGAALNEVQAVNSVFSSASLPVSVNAEGSYLNQIFLGMFRPDSSGAPRWLGNLKQYQLVRSAGNLVMGDALGKAAINPKTGFLSPNATSYWSYKDLSNLPDSSLPDGTTGGFFINDLKGEPANSFEAPDGEVVEKGGVAQQLRKQNLSATFAGAGATSVNPRRVYTYCPDQDTPNCKTDLTDPVNDFSTANTKIVAADFGTTLTLPVTSIVRNAGTDKVTVTTSGKHGFSTGSTVTIRNANQQEYNVSKSVTVLNSTQFTVTVPENPPLATTVSYTVSRANAGGSVAITSISRGVSGGSSNQETVTVTTASPHGFGVGSQVQIFGAQPAQYNNTWTVTAASGNTLTFSIPITPTAVALNKYSVVQSPKSFPVSTITKTSLTANTVDLGTPHGFHAGQVVTISGIKGKYANDYNKDHTIVSVTANAFVISVPTGGDASGGSVVTSTTAYQPTTVVRNGTGSGSGASLSAATTATLTGVWPANFFATGDQVDVTYASGTAAGEPTTAVPGSYVTSKATITCAPLSVGCLSFSYAITASPDVTATTPGFVSAPGTFSFTAPAGSITRSGTVGRVTGVPSGLADGGTVVIAPATSPGPDAESNYAGSFKITCASPTDCSSFTFPVVVSPQSPATGTNIQAYSGTTAPDKDVLIRWLRGEDNHGDEKGPGRGITVRPSVHGDVLHSRPLVINYGDARGIVVFYGSNDGVFRAVNGNQRNPTTTGGVTVPAGGEFWGLVLQEHYNQINRYRTNSPEVKFPSTFVSTAEPKKYFVDGPTGVYQKLDANGVIEKAVIFMTMRRGGRLMYAIDVTQPDKPVYLWSKNQQSSGFSELGQTWSRPRLTLLQNYKTTVNGKDVATPVLVFGAGYDPNEDFEPPKADTMGRGIFVVEALTGNLVWSASVSCPASTANCAQVANMKYATPSDISFVDRDQNGLTDKFYWGDLGGNVWRADVADADISKWSVTQVAALGCNTGACTLLTTPRKFFFPPSVLSVRQAGDPNSYEVVSIVSGDREHPLRDDATTSAFNTNDRFFMVKDLGTTVNNTSLNTKNVVPNDLFNATYTAWNSTGPGFYINFIGAGWNETTNQPDPSKTPTKGEKAVNAPAAVNGQIFFATNQPRQADNTCTANLGTARAYAVNPFTGAQVQNELEGGGLPPSAVSGLITITETKDGQTTTTQEKFCIGCGISGSQLPDGTNKTPCTSALENCNVGATIPKDLKRTYWYKK